VNEIIELGALVLDAIERLGRATLFLGQILVSLVGGSGGLRFVVQQIYAIGVRTLLVVVVSGLFVGLALGLEVFTSLQRFGAQSSLGLVVALSLLRELGPVVTALLFAGRAGSALAAEIGLMKATEQLAGMEMMAVDPMGRVVLPRFVAGALSMPLLAAIFSLVGIFGGYLVGVGLIGVDSGIFWSQMHSGIGIFSDLGSGMLKSVVFGIVVTWIAVFEGYQAEPTAEGVGRATTRTVVASSLAVLGLDFIMTALMMRGLG